MSNMVSFEYSGFWDVPLGIFVMHWGKAFVLIREFDEDRDEYEDHYDVYVLPDAVAPLTRGISENFWNAFTEKHLSPTGRVPIRLVKFDDTKRKELDPSFLDEFVGGAVNKLM